MRKQTNKFVHLIGAFSMIFAVASARANDAKVTVKDVDFFAIALDHYHGTVGNSTVDVDLGLSNDGLVGHYHYGRTRPDGDALHLRGKRESEGDWLVTESLSDAQGHMTVTGEWRLHRSGNSDWTGTWTRPGAVVPLSISLHWVRPNSDYLIESAKPYVQEAMSSQSEDMACSQTVHFVRNGMEIDTIKTAVQLSQDCSEDPPRFVDFNFDGYADMITLLFNSLHNREWRLWKFDPMRNRFIDAGSLTEPEVDVVHKNIVSRQHYSAISGGVEIYRFKPGSNEPVLIERSMPCDEDKRVNRGKSCWDMSGYDRKTGEIQRYNNDE